MVCSSNFFTTWILDVDEQQLGQVDQAQWQLASPAQILSADPKALAETGWEAQRSGASNGKKSEAMILMFLNW